MHDLFKDIDRHQLSYECARFLRDYLPTFRGNFARFCNEAEVQPDLPVSKEIFAEKLYLAMFGAGIPGATNMLDDTLAEIVNKTLDAEPVLLRSWMRLINDFVDVLEATSNSTNRLLELVAWVDALSMRLYHTYFRISRDSRGDESRWTEEMRKESHALAQEMKGFIGVQDAAEERVQGSTFLRGIPVDYPLEVLAVESDHVSIKTDRRHAAVLSRVPSTVLQLPGRAWRIIARTCKCNVADGTAELRRFVKLEAESDRRENVRVEPEREIDVLVRHPSGTTRGTILDLSDTAIALYVRNDGIDLSDFINLHFELPGNGDEIGGNEIDTDVQVAYIRPDLRNDTRAHILILTVPGDSPAKTVLARYVALRQTAILKEIRHIMEGQA